MQENTILKAEIYDLNKIIQANQDNLNKVSKAIVDKLSLDSSISSVDELLEAIDSCVPFVEEMPSEGDSQLELVYPEEG